MKTRVLNKDLKEIYDEPGGFLYRDIILRFTKEVDIDEIVKEERTKLLSEIKTKFYSPVAFHSDYYSSPGIIISLAEWQKLEAVNNV